MPHAYTEDQLVEQPAKAGGPPSPWSSPSGRGDDGLFAEYSALPNPHPRPFSHWEKGGQQAGLRVRSLVVLVPRLRAALVKLNPALPPEAIAAAVDELTRDRSAMSPYLSGWRMAGVTRAFPTSSYLSRKRPA